jgi:phage terminase large subunit
MTDIKYVDKLHPIFTKPKRVKIIVGGRGSTKSTGIADYVLACMAHGQLWCCAREFQSSIDESVHRTMIDEIDRLGISGFEPTKTCITHSSGGRNFYKGLARNITSLKSTLSGIDGLWIEEGEDLSALTLMKLTASVRLNAKDTEKALAGDDVKLPEIFITMNRGSRKDPISQRYLERAEPSLARTGFYEDDAVMIAELNYTDMPQSWFIASGLEVERADDYERMNRAAYEHKWLGKYLEAIENGIIKPEWFDAAIDAHKDPRFNGTWQPTGAIKVAHDPSDEGSDAKGLATLHGTIFKTIKEKTDGDITEGFFWAMDEARREHADLFIYDGDGMGSGAKGQVASYFEGMHTKHHMFRGSLSGKAQDNAQEYYIPSSDDELSRKTYAEEFFNNRAQYYIRLANMFYNTYRCIIKGEYKNPDDMVSIDSDGVDNLNAVKAEICRIPLKPNNAGKKQIMSKVDMKRNKIDSPNMADPMMMALFNVRQAAVVNIEFDSEWD